jgi:hypothetical protein
MKTSEQTENMERGMAEMHVISDLLNDVRPPNPDEDVPGMVAPGMPMGMHFGMWRMAALCDAVDELFTRGGKEWLDAAVQVELDRQRAQQ